MVKLVKVLLLLLCTPVVAIAVEDSSRFQLLAFPYMIADVGASYSLSLNYKVSKKLYLNIGGKFHQNIVWSPKLNNEKLHHRFYAKELNDHIGITLGLVYYLKWRYDFVQPYLYYDFTFFNMDTKADYLPDDSSDNTDKAIPLVTVRYTNLYSFENGIGIGATAAIASNLKLNTRVGVSANIISNLPVAYYPSGLHINAAIQYAIGLQYNFDRRRNR